MRDYVLPHVRSYVSGRGRREEMGVGIVTAASVKVSSKVRGIGRRGREREGKEGSTEKSRAREIGAGLCGQQFPGRGEHTCEEKREKRRQSSAVIGTRRSFRLLLQL
jgi:hypothetical protein